MRGEEKEKGVPVCIFKFINVLMLKTLRVAHCLTGGFLMSPFGCTNGVCPQVVKAHTR